jgi:hypothetical protein
MDLGVIVGAAIGVGGTGLGVTLNSRRDDRLRKEERDASLRDELRLAMRRYLAAIDAITAELSSDLPAQTPLNRLDSQLLKIGKALGLDFVALIIGRLLQRGIFGTRPHQLIDRLSESSAHLRLIAPLEIERIMLEAEGLTKRYKPHDEQWMNEWREYRNRMRSGFRQALDQLDDATQ